MKDQSLQESHDNKTSQLLSRLLRGGLPALAAGIITALMPIIGIRYLDASQYAVWALASTLVTVFLIIDFGTVALSVSLGSAGEASAPIVRRLLVLTAAPPILLSIVAVLVWPIYSAKSDIDASIGQVVLTFLLIGIGGALRSIGLIYAGIALGRKNFVGRARILVGGAVTQVAAAYLLLELGFDSIALAYSVVLSGLIQVLMSLSTNTRKLDPDSGSESQIDRVVLEFARAKGLITVLGIIVTQMDRWVLGLSGSTEFLSTYDVATRITMMPKVALIALMAGLIGDASRLKMSERDGLVRLHDRAFLLNALFAVLGGFVTAAVCALILRGEMGQIEAWATVVTLIAIAQTASALTIPITMILAGMRRPQIELRYMVPLSMAVGVAYYLGISHSDSWVVLFGWAGSVALASVAFAAAGFRIVRRAAWT
ncbi:hypothetical protein GS571_03695 [Rhodococcus hoagii]|nr:hypothetical protein [Prescottella equi]